MSVTCEYCHKQFSSCSNRTRHLKTCKSKVEALTSTVETGIVTLTVQLKESVVENRFLKEQVDSLKEQLKQQEDRAKEQGKQLDRLNDQLFKLANRTTTNTTNTTILQRNNYLISSLAPLNLGPDRIQKIIDENYTPERFKQGLEGAIQTINDIIRDPDASASNKLIKYSNRYIGLNI